MYSELLKKEKVESNLKGRVILGESEECSAERLKDMLLGFCTREDLVLVPQKRVHELFEDYCQKNGYPLFFPEGGRFNDPQGFWCKNKDHSRGRRGNWRICLIVPWTATGRGRG